MISGGVVPGRQLSKLGLRTRRNLRDRTIDAGIGLQEYFDDRDAIQRLRFDVLNVVDDGGQFRSVMLTMRSAMSFGTRPL